MTEKRCGRCSLVFPCGGYGCWCTDVPVTDRQFDWIADRYKDCLCPACLAQVSRGEVGPRPSNPEPAS